MGILFSNKGCIEERMKKISLGIALLFLTVSQGLCQESPLQLTIKSNKEIYEVGDEIIISGYFKNVSPEKIYVIKDDKLLLWCRLTVENPDGIEFWYDPYPTMEFGPASPNAYTAILPNKTLEYFTFKVVAGELGGHESNWNWDRYTTAIAVPKEVMPFCEKGQYKIKFQYINLTPTRKDALKGTFTSNTITIKVVEKKRAQFNERIDALIKKYRDANPEEDAKTAFNNNNLTFMGIGGFVPMVPGVENFDPGMVYQIPETSDFIVDAQFQRIAHDYAERYNKEMLRLIEQKEIIPVPK